MKRVIAILIILLSFVLPAGVAMAYVIGRSDMPDEFEVKSNIQAILSGDIVTNYAIILMLYCMRTQIFMDGNKRTSMLAANHLMIRNGKGIISVPLEEQDIFRKLLIEYYETGNMYKAREFIYDRCIDGIHFDT